jgi:hypothetical protein
VAGTGFGLRPSGRGRHAAWHRVLTPLPFDLACPGSGHAQRAVVSVMLQDPRRAAGSPAAGPAVRPCGADAEFMQFLGVPEDNRRVRELRCGPGLNPG